MIEFAWIYMIVLLPLPLLLRWLLPRAQASPESALRVPFFAAMPDVSRARRSTYFHALPAAVAWSLLVLAASRPQYIGEPVSLPVSGRDLMLAVDISGSMRTEDMQLNGAPGTRLEMVHAVAGEFIERRAGDRLGLILFGSQAYLQTPLTFDRKTVRLLLEESEIGLAGKETAIGDAIGLAIKRLRQRAQDTANPVLILLTDGANNAGEIDPRRAGDLAAQQGLRIYTIGVGADEMRVPGPFGNERVNPSADLDETVLREVADNTGGRYFRARDTDELKAIYNLLDELEPVAVDEEVFRPKKELYPWPLAAALLLSYLLALGADGRKIQR